MHENGRMLRCDRCEKEIFTKFCGTDTYDGGFTRVEKFEKPDGWKSRNVDGAYKDLCPYCDNIYRAIKDKHTKDWEHFMLGVE